MASITQYPTYPNTWVHNKAQDYTRIFTDYVIRPDSSEPWSECTDSEKISWEESHPAPEPESNEQ